VSSRQDNDAMMFSWFVSVKTAQTVVSLMVHSFIFLFCFFSSDRTPPKVWVVNRRPAGGGGVPLHSHSVRWQWVWGREKRSGFSLRRSRDLGRSWDFKLDAQADRTTRMCRVLSTSSQVTRAVTILPVVWSRPGPRRHGTATVTVCPQIGR
jgi:hypothetical protein